MKKALWISGWGIDPILLQKELEMALPQISHTVQIPIQNAFDQLDLDAFDFLCGYSLGSILLQGQSHITRLKKPMFLFAPFASFLAEDKVGGITPLRNLRLMQKQLLRNPLDTINNFYQHANLPYHLDQLPYPLDDLQWGLQQLAQSQVEPASPCQSWAGANDSLLDAKALPASFSVTIVPEAGHHISSLLQFSLHAF